MQSPGREGDTLSPLPTDPISSFLDYMHRRFSDFVATDSRPIPSLLSNANNGDSSSALVGGTSGITFESHNSIGTMSQHNPAHFPESPSVHRAGLLQPISSSSSSSQIPISSPDFLLPHTPDSIRATTLQLSNMPFSASLPPSRTSRPSFRTYGINPSLTRSETEIMQLSLPLQENASISDPPHDEDGGFIFPHVAHTGHEPNIGDSTSFQSSQSLNSSFLREIPGSSTESDGASVLESSIGTLPPLQKLSGLSLLRPSSSTSSFNATVPPSPSTSSSPRPSSVSSVSPESPPPFPNNIDVTPTATPMGTPRPSNNRPLPSLLQPQINPSQTHVRWRSPRSIARLLGPASPSSPTVPQAHEQTPLLGEHEQGPAPRKTAHINENGNVDGAVSVLTDDHHHSPSNSTVNGQDPELGWSGGIPTFLRKPRPFKSIFSPSCSGPFLDIDSVKAKVKQEVVVNASHHLMQAVNAVPAVLLGCLLNILDGVSYGMIIFPATGVFANLGPMGVSMFFISTVLAQLVYTLGGSGFHGANGSMMIEVVPFFHIMATSIASKIGEDDPSAVIATTLAAYAFSSILTGLAFFLLGALKLGVIVGFFPRHILVGCIGGVGAFLIETGLTVSVRISDDDFNMNWETFQFMFLDMHNLLLWGLPLFLAIFLRFITHKYHHQLIFPLYFIVIPLVFYVVVAVGKLDLNNLRTAGWIFDMGPSVHEPWYKFYSYFNFSKVRYSVLWSTLPTQFALLFFNVLHPPLNVPALAVSINTDVDTNKELVAHGYSNFLAGLAGTVPNYLVYVNTLLFYRVGGGNRIAAFLLAIATAILLVIGTGPIAYIPVMVVGALIFVLGIDLVKEALWDTRHRVSTSEYITIISIMICMTAWDFVVGVLFGIVVSCFFFVVQNSQLRSIRAIHTGDATMSAVRRPSLQRAYIRGVSKQTTILRLQGFLFFGTITHVEESIRSLIEGPYWQYNPVQFLVLDLTLVAGVDMSSAEAFVRIQRLLAAKYVTLVFCGFKIDSPVGKALRCVDVLGADGVELFSTFNDAIEWTENAYLRAWFGSQKVETFSMSLATPSRQEENDEYNSPVESLVRSPRRSHLRDVGGRTIATEVFSQHEPERSPEPINTLTKAFSSYGSVDSNLFRPIDSYFERFSVPAGHVLWTQGDPPDGLYVIESGVLRASYQFANPAQHFEESMVAGTLAGELSALSDSTRNATVVVEHSAVLWKLSTEHIRRLQLDEPELARTFIQLVLKAAKLDYDILLGAIASRQ